MVSNVGNKAFWYTNTLISMFCLFNNTKNYVETKSWIFLCDILAKANIFYVIKSLTCYINVKLIYIEMFNARMSIYVMV